MINPLTFDSDTTERFWTYSRDEASFFDCITGARTSSELQDKDYGLWIKHPEAVGRGSSQNLITDFKGVLNKDGTTFIYRLKGFIAGRYFEIENEKGQDINKNYGIGLFIFNAFDRDNNQVIITNNDNAGAIAGSQPINATERGKSGGNIAGRVLLYAKGETYPKSLYVTLKDSYSEDMEGPYNFDGKGTINFSLKSGNSLINVGNFGGYSLSLSLSTVKHLSKDLGLLGFIKADGFDIKKNSNTSDLFKTVNDITYPLNNSRFNFRGGIYTNNKDALSSGYFGSIIDTYKSYSYNPTLYEVVTTMLNSAQDVVSIGRSSNIIKHDTAKMFGSGGLSKPDIKLKGFNDEIRMIAKELYNVRVNNDDYNIIIEIEDIRMNDFNININSIEYITSNEAARVAASSVVIPGRDSFYNYGTFAKIKATIDLNNIKINVYKTVDGNKVDKVLDLSLDKKSVFEAVYLYPLSSLAVYDNNGKIKDVKNARTESDFKKLLNDSSSWYENNYFESALKPFVGLHAVNFIYYGNASKVYNFLKKDVVEHLNEKAQGLLIVYALDGITQDTKPLN